MATRVWLTSSGAAPVQPLVDPSWDVEEYKTGGRTGTLQPTYDRLQAVTVRPTQPFTPRVSPKAISGAAQRTILRQYVMAPLNAGTIAVGTVKGILRALSVAEHSGTVYPIGLYVSIRVVSRNGLTVRGTLFALQTDGTPTTALSSSAYTDRKIPATWTGSGLATTAVTASQGDRIVIEIGVGKQGTPGGGPYVSTIPKLDFGVTTTDLPEDETGTSQLSPWVEFSQNLSFESAGGGVIDPGTAPASVSPATTPALRTGISWKLFLCTLAGVPIVEITDVATNCTLTCSRNAAATLTFQVPANAAEIATVHTDGVRYLHARDRIVKAYRLEGGVMVCRFAGRVQSAAGDLGDSARLGVICTDPLDELKRQMCRDSSFNLGIGFGDTPAGDIVRTLIENANNYAAANSWPITGMQSDGATIPALATASPQYTVKDVFSAVMELGQSDTAGFDVWAAPLDHTDSQLARLMMYAKPAGQGNSRPDVQFGWHAPPFNLTSLKIVDAGDQQANIAIAQSGTTTAVVTDPTSLTRYGPTHKVVSGSGDAEDSGYLSGLATKALSPDPPRVVQQASPKTEDVPEPWLAWFIGDTVKVNIGADGGIYQGQQSMTIEAFTVSLDDEEKLKSLTVRQ